MILNKIYRNIFSIYIIENKCSGCVFINTPLYILKKK